MRKSPLLLYRKYSVALKFIHMHKKIGARKSRRRYGTDTGI